MSLDILNPVILKKLKGIGGFTYINPSLVDNENFWDTKLLSDQIVGDGFWSELNNPVPLNRSRTSIGIMNDNIYYLTGFDGASFLLYLVEYDISTGTHTHIPGVDTGDGIPTPRYGSATGLRNGNFYMVGGLEYSVSPGGGQLGGDSWSVDVNTGSWQKINDSPHTSDFYDIGGVFNQNGLFYTIGGGRRVYDSLLDIVNYYSSNVVYSYNPSNNTWNDTLSTLPYNIQSNAIVTNGSYIYSIGGVSRSGQSLSYLNYNLRYNVSSDAWEEMAICPVFVNDHSATVYNNKIYIFGGNDASGNRDDSYVYDIISDSWSYFTDLPTGVNFNLSSAVTYNSSMFVTGGGELWKFEYNASRTLAVERIY